MRPAGAVELRTPDTALVARARAFLTAGPSDSQSLISYVCQLPGAPRVVAEHMATALFERLDGFQQDREGRWILTDRADDAGLVRTDTGIARLRDLAYVVVDVETTGGSALAGDRITEVAAVQVRGGEIVDVFETLVNPERSIPRFVTALTRITWDMVKSAPRFADVAPRLSDVLDGNLFVAHNATFDWRFICAELERANGGRLRGERLCTVRLARAFLPQIRRRSLDSLAHYYGVEIAARHRAGGDAVATARILIRLLREAESQGCVTLDDLMAATNQRRPTARRRRRRGGLPRPSDGDLPA
jgi:DNA polymerase III subunit epsilon